VEIRRQRISWRRISRDTKEYEVNATKQNETNEDEMNAIIRLPCIERYRGFIYKKVRNNGPEWKQISENSRGSD